MIELPAGTEFAGLRLEAVTGRGGMGVVYRASELALERTVALKVMVACLIEDEAALRRFARESRLAASIEHPNVIPIHAAGEHDGRADIVMRCVEGADLRALTRHEGPLAAERAAPIVAQAAAGLGRGAPRRARPPGREAGEHPARRRRTCVPHRLRAHSRRLEQQRAATDEVRRVRGDVRLCGAGTDPRRRRQRPRRLLSARRGDLPRPHRRGAVRGPQPRGDPLGAPH